MIVLGIDPGIAIMGYGLVETVNGKLNPIDFGVVTTPANMAVPTRLVKIYDAAQQLIEKYNPHCVAIEELFFNKNVKTALLVGHARGATVIAAAKKNMEVFEYTPLQIKQAITGYGRADKNQVQQMVKMMLNLKKIPKPDDAADAVAVAVCHINSSKMARRMERR